MSSPTIHRRRAELLLNLARVAVDNHGRHACGCFAAEELAFAADLERSGPQPWQVRFSATGRSATD